MKFKIDLIKNATTNGFEYDGKVWTLATKSDGTPKVGTSANGLWNDYTNGKITLRLYKADLIDAKRANLVKALF